MQELPATVLERLSREQHVWLATSRPDGRPHLVPLWYVWYHGAGYLCVSSLSVKMRNLIGNPAAALALEDGSHPVVFEGVALPCDRPWLPAVVDAFQQKYDWLITADSQYDVLLKFTPSRLLMLVE